MAIHKAKLVTRSQIIKFLGCEEFRRYPEDNVGPLKDFHQECTVMDTVEC